MKLDLGQKMISKPTAGRVMLAVCTAISLCLLPNATKPIQAAGSQFKVPSYAIYVDTVDDDGLLSDCTDLPWDCSLRGALNKANSTPGGDIIYLPAGTYKLTGDASEDHNKSGDLDIFSRGGNLTLYGEAMDRTIIDGNFNDRILHTPDFYSPFSISIKNLSIQNGYAPGSTDGGAIRSYASLYLNNVRLANNSARNGAGLYFYSTLYNTLTIENSIISDNYAWKDGAGLYLWAYNATIKNSSLYQNKAEKRGGAIFNDTQLIVNTSTFYGNTAEDGGGIFVWAFLGDRSTVDLTNCTLAQNSIALDIHTESLGNTLTEGLVRMSNTIIANSTDGENCEKDIKTNGKATYENGGANLDSGVSCGFGDNFGSIFGQDPKLGSLEDNGGPAPTLALLDDSPAINSGNPSTCTHRDERGLAAVEICDIGAFEYNAVPVLTPWVGASKTEMNGVYGSQLGVNVRNAFGNSLEGWRIEYRSPDYLWVTLSSAQEISDENGSATITASNEDISGKPKLVTAKTGTAIAQFSMIGQSVFGRLYSGMPYYLPLTGFSPGVKTRLGSQPEGKQYQKLDKMDLEIPVLDVNIPITGVPKFNGDWDLSWLGNSAGYLEGTTFPTWSGNSALTAHAVLADGTEGPFYRLGKLKWGDQIIVSAWGNRYVYEVRAVQTVKPEVISVLKEENLPWLTLITCRDFNTQNQTYTNRQVVKAVLIEVNNN